jgi:CRP/FNR family cyclic AMP-dependent transcriptional regulator
MFTLASEETYSDGQIIFREESPGDWVYVILSGSVEISKMIGSKRFVLEVLKEGDVFGELSFIGGIKRTAIATAIGEATVGIIERDTLDQEFNKLSSDFRSILVTVVKRFKTMIDRVIDFSVRTQERVPKKLSVSYPDRNSFLKAYTSNISGGGLFIKTSSPLPQGEMILLKLQLPGIPDPLRIKCSVAWAKKKEEAKGTHPAGMGIKFGEMSNRDRQTLQDYINTIIQS